MKQNSNSTVHSSLFIILCSFYIVIILAITSCTKSTSPQTGSLSGRVVLVNDTGDPSLDPVDYSGVTVALYELAELDTTIVRINQEYPNIGVQISQETAFDYHIQSPLYSVLTGPEGDFNLLGVCEGLYNIVIRSELWGMRLIYNVDIKKGQNTIDDVILYPIVYFDNTELNRVSLLENHLYRITTDSQILNGADILGPCYIEIGAGKLLRVIGDLSNINNSYVFINKVETETDDKFLGIEFLNQSSSIRKLVLRNSLNGIKIVSTVGSIVVEDCLFSSSDVGLYIAPDASSDVRNCLYQSCVSSNDNYSALLLSTFGSVVSKNIFVGNTQAIKSYQYSANYITDNYFQNNNIGVDSSYDSGDSIRYNTFLSQSSYAIKMTAIDSCYIEYNQIVGPSGIHHYYQGTGGYAPIIRNNNLNCSFMAIKTDITHTPHDLIADSNYFFTTDTSRIDELIWDENDRLIEYPNESRHAGYVIYTPFRNRVVTTAGIRG